MSTDPATSSPALPKQRPLFGPTAYSILKLVHVALIAIWIGTAFAGLFMLLTVMNEQTVVGVTTAIQHLDLLVWIPVNVLTLLTGILFSLRTRWRFFKHRWIIAKYIINLLPLTMGGPVLAPQVITMTTLTEAHGAAAWGMAEFSRARFIFAALLVAMLALLLLAVLLSIFKPRLRRRKRSSFTLRVSHVIAETADTASFVLTVPRRLRQQFAYNAGQYISTVTTHQGRQERRAYSLASAPHEPDLKITVKREPGGIVSNYLNDTLHTGSKLTVLPPQGRFTHRLNLNEPHTCYLIGAGSGIVPLRSIATAVLRNQPASSVHFLYANRTPETAIFRAELTALAQAYPNCTLDELFSRLPADHPWSGARGHLNTAELRRFLDAYPATAAPLWLLCGPAGFVDLCRASLTELGVPAEQIRAEYFTPRTPTPASNGASDTGVVTLHASLDGETIDLLTDRQTTLTTALEDAGYDPPYTCLTGSCSTCVAKILAGSVQMRECHALDQDEIAAGLILTCQALPRSETVTISFDDAQ